MIGAEFLGMILFIVYVGAVAVLLFVVMMLNVAQQKQSWFIGRKSTHIPSGLIVAVIIFLELLVIVGGWKYKPNVMNSSNLIINQETTNTHFDWKCNVYRLRSLFPAIRNNFYFYP